MSRLDTELDTEAGKTRLELEDSFLCGSTFSRVNLKDAVFTDSVLVAARFHDVNATGLVFENVNLSGASFDDVNLSGVSISDANLTGMTIDGILVSDLLEKWHGA